MNADASSPTTGVPTSELAARLQVKINSLVGVERVHPTIRYTVASITAGHLKAATSSLGTILAPGSAGVDVYQHDDNTVDVTIDISTEPSRDALATSREIRRLITAELAAIGCRPRQLMVTVRG